MDQTDTPIVTFRCPPELAPVLPWPVPAVEGIPEWFKAMPPRASSEVFQREQLTVKKCPPFIDARTCGFLIPMPVEVEVENGEFRWDHMIPRGSSTISPRSPIDFHDNSQMTGSPFFDDDRVLVKFNSFWTSSCHLFVTHPINRS
jgi:hypothetical protein